MDYSEVGLSSDSEQTQQAEQEVEIPSGSSGRHKPLFADLEESSESTEENPSEDPKNPLSRFPQDPILVLQLLQVHDREYYAKVREEKETIENAKDEYNEMVELVLNLNSGLAGFVRKAVLGSNVPPNHARLLEAMQGRISLLEQRLEFRRLTLEEARDLAARAEETPDRDNTTILRQRALLTLEQEPPAKPLEEANRRVEMFRKLLTECEEEVLHEAEEEQLAEEESETSENKRSLGDLSQHFEAFKAEKSEEMKQKVLSSEVGKRGLSKLQALAEKLEKKREEKYSRILSKMNS